MATIEDYTTGRICEKIAQAFSVFESTNAPLAGTEIGQIMLDAVNPFEPRKLAIEEAVQLVEQSQECAIGERVCRALHTDTPFSEAVFLDELARGMIEVGKARPASRSEAVATIRSYRKPSIIVSKVSGKYAEICPTWAKKCVYWNMEKHKLKCIIR